MEIVINEWLLEYLRPDAQVSEKKKAIGFLNAFMNKQDKLVIKENSPFVKKFYRFMKDYGSDISFKKNFSKLRHLQSCSARELLFLLLYNVRILVCIVSGDETGGKLFLRSTNPRRQSMQRPALTT